MALVEHERHTGVLLEASVAIHLEDDSEQLERVSCSHNQVVIGIETGVEVERTEAAQPQELRDDEFDVGPRCVVSGVQTHMGFGPQSVDLDIGGSPVGNIGVVERWLEELVFEDQALILAQTLVDGTQRIVQPVLAGADIDLAGVVGSIGEPNL